MNIEKLVKNFQSRGYVVRVFDTAEQANNFILEQTDGMSVGLGGSMTVEQMGLFNLLEKRGNDVRKTAIQEASLAKGRARGFDPVR